jgi:murein DD-endopeptidase MepM/ murein hydrolase activator NlpD
MTRAIVRIGERARLGRVAQRVTHAIAHLATWARGKKARFADLHALRLGRLPAAGRQDALQRQLAVIVGATSGSACALGYCLAIVATGFSHGDAVPREARSVSVAGAPAEPVIAPADLTFDVARLNGPREAAIEQVIVERAQSSLDRDRAVAERDAALAERDAAVAADREMLLDLHARTNRTIAEIEGILAATGINTGRVIKASSTQDRTRPRGGPFVPWSDRSMRDGGSDSARRLASLTWGVERLGTLRDLLAHIPLASPLAHLQIFDGFGFRHDPFTGRAALHEGVDLRGTIATPVMATADGTVAFAGWHSDYGNMVEIDHGYGLTTRYAHLSKIVVKAGMPIALHQHLGFVGATGRVTALHLHYEVRVDGRARNPVNFFKAGHHVPEADHAVAQEIPNPQDAFAGFDSGQGAPDFWRAVDRQR